jgi:hypothetical protein
MQNKCVNTCAFPKVVVSLHQKKKQKQIKTPRPGRAERDGIYSSLQHGGDEMYRV